MSDLAEESQPTSDLGESDSVAFSALALDLHEADDAEETLDRIVEYSRDAVACDGAGVLLLHARGRLETVASTNAEVDRAHDLQVELGEGPCLAAVDDPTMMFRVDDAATDTQWPRWNAEVARLGFRSVLAAPLSTHTRRYGSLNLYAGRPNAFDDDDEAVAMILARHASVALSSSHQIDGLRSAVDARKIIGIAMGVLMERYDLDTHVAFDVLRRYSQANNVKLRAVAERVVTERTLPQAW